MTLNGLDYSLARPPSPFWLAQNGFGFVCRYLSDYPSKNITKAEYDALRAAGVDVVLNWENDGNDFAGGAANGKAFATRAMQQAQALGAWPCPIYFSKDVHADLNDDDRAFLRAAGDVIGLQRVGGYGSRLLCLHAMAEGLAKYGWMNVWLDGGDWEPSIQLWQTGGGNLGWGSVDFNQANAADFGQVGGDPAPQEDEMGVGIMRSTIAPGGNDKFPGLFNGPLGNRTRQCWMDIVADTVDGTDPIPVTYWEIASVGKNHDIAVTPSVTAPSIELADWNEVEFSVTVYNNGKAPITVVVKLEDS